MHRTRDSRRGFFLARVVTSFALLSSGLLLALSTVAQNPRPTPAEASINRNPRSLFLTKAARSFTGDLRRLPKTPPRVKPPKPQHEIPGEHEYLAGDAAPEGSALADLNAPAPGPINSFDGLGRAVWGDGYPPDPVGDVGPNHYIQSINTSLAVYDKSSGAVVAGPFTYDTLMSQGNFGNLCDTNNYGDPVVLYDSFNDRWIVSDFAFIVTAAGAIQSPPGAFQCFAVSKTGDPVTGGYSQTKYVASFVGFAPAASPRLLVTVMVDEPKGEIYGGLIAAPAFKEIMSFALNYLRIPPK